jgi:hypothetical protein
MEELADRLVPEVDERIEDVNKVMGEAQLTESDQMK